MCVKSCSDLNTAARRPVAELETGPNKLKNRLLPLTTLTWVVLYTETVHRYFKRVFETKAVGNVL